MDLELRASDDERHATISRLAEHYRTGRLTAEELEQRTASAQTAVTCGDLTELERDLPMIAAPRQSDRSEVQEGEQDQRHALRDHVVTYAVVIVFLWAIWLATGAHYPWPIWPMLGWGLAVVLHAVTGRPPQGLPGPPLPPALPRPRRARRDRRRP